ncbi:MAG: hypothetical protein LBI81_03875, partial [Puniceicoccales bacterium]|nr:hypothetical protein [Puniceicoccales bacterium]
MKHGKMRCHSGSKNPHITDLDRRILNGLLTSQCSPRAISPCVAGGGMWKWPGKTLDIGQTFHSVITIRETVVISMGSRIAKFVKKAAKDRRLMVSNYLK